MAKNSDQLLAKPKGEKIQAISPYKRYVNEYSLNLIARQLVSSERTLLQLAEEFGYSDESHLSNAFKAHFHQTPSFFRKKK